MAIRIIDSSASLCKRTARPSSRDFIFDNCTAYESRKGSRFRVVAHELGHGHFEASAVRMTEWDEVPMTEGAMRDYLEACERAALEDAEEKAAQRLRIAANRARVKVRRLCKAMGADTLLTLTYRANEKDLSQVKRDLKEFNRRMLRVMPTFRFVGAFEKQDRGAYHVHMATAGIPRTFTLKNANGNPVKIKSFDVIRSVWRSVTKERQGNIDVARRKAAHLSSPAAIAAYISKYISKEFVEGEPGSNRYTAYGDFELPPSVDLGTVDDPMTAIEVLYSCLGTGRVVFGQHYSPWGDWYYLHGQAGNKKPPKALALGGLMVG